MRRTATLLLALGTLLVAPTSAGAEEETPAPETPDRLSVSFFSASFLAEVVARVVAERILAERYSGGYLEEKTGLVWARSDNGADVDWYEAQEHCRELEIADWTDWRTPTIEELEHLHDRRSNARFKLPFQIRLSGCCPWSATRNGETSAWNFSFRYRKRFSGSLNYSFELRALCVRTASEEDLLFFEELEEEASLAGTRPFS